MEPLRISFSVSILKDSVRNITGHAGVTKGAYSQYVCDDDRWPLALPMMDEAVNIVQHALRRDIIAEGTTVNNVENEYVSIGIDRNKPVSDETKRQAIMSIFNAVTKIVCSLWVRTFDAELSAIYKADADSMIVKALDFLRVRDIQCCDESQIEDTVAMGKNAQAGIGAESQIDDSVPVNDYRCDWPGHVDEDEARKCQFSKAQI